MRSAPRSGKILAIAQANGGDRPCAMRDCASCWLNRALTLCARPSRCFTRCNAGTVRTFPVIARFTFGFRSTNCAVATAKEFTRALNEAPCGESGVKDQVKDLWHRE